jgi:hypothetical protein
MGHIRQESVIETTRRFNLAHLGLACALACTLSACHSTSPVDTAPLDHAGMSYDAIQQAKALRVTPPEIASLARARQSGLSDVTCVTLLQIFRARGQSFSEGDTAAGMLQAGLSEETIVELARLNQLGFGAGELQAMRLAGLSDEIILEVARRRSASQPVLAGASLADLKNAGLREATLLELARRGVPDSQASMIASSRKHGATDADILRRFPGS